MTGAELIRHLVSLGPENLALPIIIRGYEGGHNDVSKLDIVEISKDHYENGHCGVYGRHLIVDDAEDKKWILEDKVNPTFIPAICLSGTHS